MAKKEKKKSLDSSKVVFNSRFSWYMPCPLVSFYPSAPSVSFHIHPEKHKKVHSFSHVFRGVNWENYALMGKTNQNINIKEKNVILSKSL